MVPRCCEHRWEWPIGPSSTRRTRFVQRQGRSRACSSRCRLGRAARRGVGAEPERHRPASSRRRQARLRQPAHPHCERLITRSPSLLGSGPSTPGRPCGSPFCQQQTDQRYGRRRVAVQLSAAEAAGATVTLLARPGGSRGTPSSAPPELASRPLSGPSSCSKQKASLRSARPLVHLPIADRLDRKSQEYYKCPVKCNDVRV
jgi:hypothetical protein